MRTTQFIGLNRRAEEYKKKHFVNFSEFCGEVIGMFGEPVCDLKRYKCKDGRVIEEYEQCVPWSSGPVIFTAFRDAKTKEPIKETLWTEDEIEKYL